MNKPLNFLAFLVLVFSAAIGVATAARAEGHLLEKTAFDAFVMDPDNDQVIVRLNGELGLSLPAPPLSLVLYSQLDNRMLRSTVNVRGRVRLRGGGGLRVTVGNSDHDMAKNLRDLHLDGARPLFVMDTHRFQSRLNLGEEIYLA